jgi:hypothetical protein
MVTAAFVPAAGTMMAVTGAGARFAFCLPCMENTSSSAAAAFSVIAPPMGLVWVPGGATRI